MGIFEELLGFDLPDVEFKKGTRTETKKETKKPASKSKASKSAEKKEEKLVFPLTVLTGIRQPIVLSKEQAGDADTLEKVADFICKQNGIPRYLTIAKKFSNSKIAVALDRGKAQAKGEFAITDASVVVVGEERIALSELKGSRTAKELCDYIVKQTGLDVTYQFIADKDCLFAVVGESVATGTVSLPVTIKSPLGDMILTAADFDESDIENNEVEIFEVEEKVFLSETHKEVGPVLALCRPSEPKDGNILYVGDKFLTRDIPKGTTSGKTMYPTNAVISLLFNSIELTPEMFGGREKVEDKDIIAILAKTYPEFTPARTRLTYEKDGNYIFPSLKSCSKGVDTYENREECLEAAKQNPVYFLGNYMENGTEVRYEKTPVSVVEASEDGTVGRFQWKLPKIPKQILSAIKDLFAWISNDYEVEALVQIRFDPYEAEYSVRIPDQIARKTTVETDDMPMSTPQMYYVMDIHSHNIMPAFFSRVDDRDEKANRVYGVMGSFNEEPEMKFRAATGGKYVVISPSDVFEEEEDGEEYVVAQALYDEWRCNVTFN